MAILWVPTHSDPLFYQAECLRQLSSLWI